MPKVVSRAPRIPFVLLVVSVLAAGLIGLLLLNTALQGGAYQITDLRQTSSSLAVEQQNLRTKVAALQQPQALAEKAQRLGMVRNDSPAFLSLSTGAIVGTAAPGVAANKVDVGRIVAPNPVPMGKVTPVVPGQLVSGSTLPELHRGEASEAKAGDAAPTNGDDR
ncbi:MAG: hypothetical protein M3445_05580 [Actinomycetota bacterium]|nr:hypothetical protein [Actinomycetota bacterium]